ncbi:MAG TPA: nucleotide exchange factor GrpE [Solirubrobacterales bacterium]|nr:nucleotide exchange factor GrpE [Solirubrobacterales bacterium]
MTQGHDEQGSEERRPAGPVPDDGGALRAGSSSTPPSSGPPAGEAANSPSGQSDADQVEQDFEELLADAQREKAEYLELARRTQADFENYRKRMAAEVQAGQARGKIGVAREVIEAVDNLERALDAAGAGDGEGLAAGVEMVLGGLRETLSRNGFEALDPKGEKFDPQWHEALSMQPVEGAESGVVVETMQKGYRIGEQLVRPARVVVSE